jgi:hypothetical protein
VSIRNTLLRRLILVAQIAGLVVVAGCVLDPAYYFEKWYIHGVIGKPLSFPTAKWEPPLSVEETDRGTRVYVYAYHYRHDPPRGDCTIFYEVKEDTIIAAWHKGPDCEYRY